MVRPALLSLALGLAAPAGLAQQSAMPVVSTEATTLNYDVDLSLAYIDRLTRSDNDMVSGDGAGFTLAAPDKPRTLGLRRARFAVDWRSVKGTRLFLVLRPDAMNRVQQDGLTTPAREVDTRAGEPYRPAPTIRMLDAYQITINALSSLSASAGVFEELATPLRSYPALLGFGLEVRFPAKFSALRLRWHDQVEIAPTGALPPRIRADLYVMQGNEDRAEAFAKKNRTADTAPAASDPYTGGASYVSFSPSPKTELGLLVGFDDSAEAGGKRNEVFGSLAGRTAWKIASVEGNVSLDVRYAKETWRNTTTDIKSRTQLSEAVTSSVKVGPRAWVLVGLANGQSDQPASALEQDKLTTVSGWDAEAGVLTSLGAGLDLQLMLSQERRTQKTQGGGGKQGGFVTDDGARSSVRRVGLELRYLLNDNA